MPDTVSTTKKFTFCFYTGFMQSKEEKDRISDVLNLLKNLLLLSIPPDERKSLTLNYHLVKYDWTTLDMHPVDLEVWMFKIDFFR